MAGCRSISPSAAPAFEQSTSLTPGEAFSRHSHQGRAGTSSGICERRPVGSAEGVRPAIHRNAELRLAQASHGNCRTVMSDIRPSPARFGEACLAYTSTPNRPARSDSGCSRRNSRGCRGTAPSGVMCSVMWILNGYRIGKLRQNSLLRCPTVVRLLPHGCRSLRAVGRALRSVHETGGAWPRPLAL